ncbi:MAG: ABC transporter ATP-binding protein [Bacteroidetes bacterium]|nr:ABC transporter ATP-binding protein [Bacteroidota bacterium]
MIKLENVSVTIEETSILKNVSFSLIKGEVLGVVGHSGEGKSTLLKAISGYQSITNGQIFFDEKLLPPSETLLIPGYRGISIVHQDYQLRIYSSVESNIRERIVDLPRDIQDKWIDDLLTIVSLEGRRKQKVISLSGGEQQRLAIVCALAEENELVLLDEPFVHMHSSMRLRLISYLIQLKKIRKTTLILVSHNGDELMGFCDRILILKKGEVQRIAKPEKLYFTPRNVYEAEFFGPINKVTIEHKKIQFRPDEFTLNGDGIPLNCSFERAEWHGAYWYNYFRTTTGKEIILFNFEPLNENSKIYIRKQASRKVRL